MRNQGELKVCSFDVFLRTRATHNTTLPSSVQSPRNINPHILIIYREAALYLPCNCSVKIAPHISRKRSPEA